MSVYIKVLSKEGVPVILYVHEAPYNKQSPVTLLSEYQVHEQGVVIDSVSSKHKTVNGDYGTQHLCCSKDVHVPFVDRGGLMGFETLPYKEGDDKLYEVFEITRDKKWTP